MKPTSVPLMAATIIASAAVAAVGPSESQLAKALAAHQSLSERPSVRHVRCQSFEEEPTEFVCRWLQRNRAGRLEEWSTYLAVDAKGYHLIDDPGRVEGERRSR
jgi:hypothetical protein